MKKILLFLLISLMAISLVLGAQGDVSLTDQQETGATDTGSDIIQAGQGTENGTQTNIEMQTQNQGIGTNLQNQEQVRVQSGNYETSNGERMQIQTENGFRLQVGGAEAKSSLEITQEQDQIQNKMKLKTQLSNGKSAEIKVMPNVASERAIERLQLNNCGLENNCSIELKEVGNGEQIKLAYEVQAQKEARVLGMFKTKMNVQAQIDAETGEVIQAKKPWWAFLASE